MLKRSETSIISTFCALSTSPNFSVLVGLVESSRNCHFFTVLPFYCLATIFLYIVPMARKKKISAQPPASGPENEHWIELGTAGRIVVPRAVREALGWNDGEKLRVRTRRGRVVISTAAGDLAFANDKLAQLTTDDD